ncbi:RING/FYVE/PHD zinc finger superfamily protein [Trifolium repens]|nr:RING/FYVE/PHD zinc finger superfamily protein [Trifolium repens]
MVMAIWYVLMALKVVLNFSVVEKLIMELWDKICTNLRARQIVVEDASRKRSMDLRLLHGVAYGHSWFGRWGYKFCQ